MKIRSNAKINLYLDITGSDPSDGYHFIDSLFQEIGLADEMEIKAVGAGADEVSFCPSVAGIGIDSTVHRALSAFREKTGIRKYYRVTVKKNIPIGAGLGGGSSNAAFLLMALGKAHRVPVSDLVSIGKGIGSDVPFFFHGGLCRVGGKGEKIEKWPGKLKNVHFLVVYPNIPVSTKWAYSLITDYTAKNKLDEWSKKRVFDIDFLKKITYNKFEHSVIRSVEKLEEAKTKLDQTLNHDLSFMSGSGSSLVFAYENRAKAKNDLRLVLDRFNFRCFLSDPFYR